MNSTILVINADDLGYSTDINAAIEELHRAGRITNASFMVDGSQVDDGLSVIRRNPNLGVGLHLDLCPVVGLYDMPYQQMREKLRTPEMQSRVAAEVDRQILKFKAFGLEFTHMDGHRHFHALPEIFSIVVDVAAGHGLKTIRLTKDWILPRTPSVFWDSEFLQSAIELLRLNGILFPDHFVYGANEYTASTFLPGVNELMVHVAHKDPEYFREYQRMSSPAFWDDLAAHGVLRRSYPQLATNPNATTA